MPYRLAVVAPRLGVRSETFIRHHMQDLLPGNTAVIVATAPQGDSQAWSVDGPCLVLDRLRAPRDMTASGQVVAMLGAVREFVEAHNVEVLLFEFLDFATSFVQLSEELDIPMFAHGHGYDVSRTLQDPVWRARYQCLNKIQGIVVVSESGKAALAGIGLDASRIHVVPCGVRIPEPPTVRRNDKTSITCLAVGRMVGKKAPILTLDAFRRAAHIMPDLTLDYVGEGPLLTAAQQFVQAFQLEGRVRLHGGTPHDVVLQFMRSADIFIQHSITDPPSGDMEGLPVAILEAMAHRLPIVSTEHAGIPEAVQHAATGFLVPEGDTRAMAEYIAMLAGDAGLRQRMGAAGYARVRQYFTWAGERAALLQILGVTDGTSPNPGNIASSSLGNLTNGCIPDRRENERSNAACRLVPTSRGAVRTVPTLTELASPPDVASERFLFIGGLHRSGTSILHRLLREHPATSGFSGTGALHNEGQHLQTVFPPAKLLGGPGRFAFVPQSHLTEASPLATSGNRDQLLREWGAHYDLNKTILLEKSPPNLIRSRLLQALFPGARFVFIVRHPIAVTLATQKWSQTTLAELLLHWHVAYSIMLTDLPYLGSYTLIRYEDFVETPQTSLGQVCDLTGLERFTPCESVVNHNDQYFARWAQSDRLSQPLLDRTMGQEGTPLALFGYSLRAPYVLTCTAGR